MARSILSTPAALLLGLTMSLSGVALSNANEYDQNGLLLEPHIRTAEPIFQEAEPAVNTAQPAENAVEPSVNKAEYLEEMHLADADDASLKVIYNLPQWVDEVTSVCPWRSASDEQQQGYIRLIRTEVEGANQLYVQWIQKLPPNKDVALATREIGRASCRERV